VGKISTIAIKINLMDNIFCLSKTKLVHCKKAVVSRPRVLYWINQQSNVCITNLNNGIPSIFIYLSAKITMMKYFTTDFLNFFNDLRANNEREWFHANKKRYEQSVKIPFQNFIADVIEHAKMFDPNILITPKDAIFRIYKDTRFSKDKTPYKLHTSAVVSRGGRKDLTSVGIYLELSDEHFGIYSGIYRPDSKQLYKIREHIAANMEEFDRLLKDKDFQEKFDGKIHGDKNKRIPKEFVEIAEQQPLLYNKAFYYFRLLPSETVLEENLPQLVMEYFKTAYPLSSFLQEALNQ